MVGHMYDENYCKSDEDMGWGENTDTRFLTTNSTTRKMCVYIRKQDDTELTQNEIDSDLLVQDSFFKDSANCWIFFKRFSFSSCSSI